MTYTYNFPDKKYNDYVCILSVLAQAAIDGAKRRYDVDITNEIQRIKLDMNIKDNGYPAFWMIIRPDFNKKKINHTLDCPMNRLCAKKLTKYRSAESTLPMEEFFHSYPLETDRRKCKKVEDLIFKYRLNLFNSPREKEDFIILREDFDKLIEDINKVYLSKSYYGLTSWLIDRAFCITPYAKSCASRINKTTDAKTRSNKALLMKVLYRVSPKSVLAVFS